MIKECLHDSGKCFDTERLECVTRDSISGEETARASCLGTICPKWPERETRHVDE